jgi:predicted ATPase
LPTRLFFDIRKLLLKGLFMLTEMQVKNFKAWRDTGRIRLAPLTVIFGTNSSGKSSLGHILLALKQTVQMSDRKRALHLGDENSLIDLGTFSDCMHGHNLNETLSFSLRWRLSKPTTVKNSLANKEIFSGNEMLLSAELVADKSEQPQINSISYALLNEGMEQISVVHGRSGAGGTLECTPLKLYHAPGRKWPAEPPEKFYRFADRTLLRYQNADFLAGFALETERVLDRVYYLGPLRSPPKRVYQWAGEMPADVGQQGEYSIAALLAASEQGRVLNRGYKQRRQRFDAFIAAWLVDLGVIAEFDVVPVAKGRKEYEVLVRTHSKASQVKLTDVGFGVSQVLPALVQAFYAAPGSTIWMEQPEIHLHPMAQSNLADAFISAIQAYENGTPRQTQLIIETHSEHFLTRLQRRVAEGVVQPSEIAIYFVRNSHGDAELETLKVDPTGEILNWPENFFGDEMADIAARALAALDRSPGSNGKAT